MTLKDAEKIVQEYGSVLARGSAGDGLAYYQSWLPHSAAKIIQAMKLWLSYEIQNHSLTEEVRNQISTAASWLPYFIEDGEAQRLNAIHSNFTALKREDLSTREFIERAEATNEVHEFATNAAIAGSSLRGELADFIAAVEQLDPNDPLYYQRIYTMAGVEYSPANKRSPCQPSEDFL